MVKTPQGYFTQDLSGLWHYTFKGDATKSGSHQWYVKEDSYHREIWLVESVSGEIIGEVRGSEFTREWNAFKLSPGKQEHLGKYISEWYAGGALFKACGIDGNA